MSIKTVNRIISFVGTVIILILAFFAYKNPEPENVANLVTLMMVCLLVIYLVKLIVIQEKKNIKKEKLFNEYINLSQEFKSYASNENATRERKIKQKQEVDKAEKEWKECF